MSSGELTLQNAPVAQLDRAPDFRIWGSGVQIPSGAPLAGAKFRKANRVQNDAAADRRAAGVRFCRPGAGPSRARPRACSRSSARAVTRSEKPAIAQTASPRRFVPSAASWISMSFSAACSAASHQAIPPCRNSNSTRTMPARPQPTCGRSSNNGRRAAHKLNLALAGFACHGIAEHGGFDQRRHLHIALRHQSVTGAGADQRLIPCRP